ncbi:MAG: hypothetical protein HC923_07070, partial [Myxococcales bacterium]|nr:hypothetical protein [Myxococcales bacterium]
MVLYPFTLLATFAHELGHGLVALSLGYDFQSLRLFPDGSGVAYWSGSPGRLGRAIVIAIPTVWLAIFFLVPFLIVLKISFSEPLTAQPPYGPTWDTLDGIATYFREFNLSNYAFLLSDPLYVTTYLNSLRIALTATLITLLVGYPMAYAMARAPKAWQGPLLMLVILPFWTSFLIRVYAWVGILKRDGLLNLGLQSLGLIDQPLTILNTEIAVYVGIVYSYLPFMVLPLYSALEKQDP